MQKKKKVTKSSRALNLVQKKVRVPVLEKYRTSYERGKEHQASITSNLERKRIQDTSSSKNSKPCTKQGQNIRYHSYGKFRMSQVPHS